MSAAQEGATEVGQGLEVTVPRAIPHLYNNNYTVRLTYAENYIHNIQINAGTADYQVFMTNSIFDPNNTGTGHQPLMRDLWASQYDYYAVLACHYKIRMYNASGQDPVTYTAAGGSGQTLGAVNVTTMATTNATDISATASTVFPIAEMKNAVTKFLRPQGYLDFEGTLTPGDFIVDAKDSDSDLTWTANGSNPSVPRYFGYKITPSLATTLIGLSENPFAAIQVQAILDYDVQFTQVNPTLRGTSS